MADEKRDRAILWGFNLRGLINISTIIILVAALFCLFALYPILAFYRRNVVALKIDGNVQINATGQFPDLPNMPALIDPDTPSTAFTRTGFDGQAYELVFSDEFNTPNRTFYPGDDPYWEAVDLWYWATGDLEWYDPGQVTTNDQGQLVITLAEVQTFNQTYRSGMLQSWNKFCFTNGYIEVSLSLPGADSDAQGYWPGAWTMGNLGRPGYGATTDGTWPYSYDSCDIGTYPNQTEHDGVSPPAANFSAASRSKYDFKLSYLSGQKLSACTCPGEDHPGPDVSVGRGAPEIDILEAQKNKLGPGGKVSQSVQMAPFNANYQPNYAGVSINDTTITQMNSYNGSAVQQAISALTDLPARVFHGTGAEFATFGFEYWTDPNNRQDGYITWQVDGGETLHVDASSMVGDSLTGISNRLISEEPMSIVLNLAISPNFQTINLDTLYFPAQFLVDYVRVYQREGQTNVGCDPPTRPTAQYIQDHLDAYSSTSRLPLL
ncbi:glycoside hydrolase family 16 protein [Sistotremastrum suecicum HHB10207 ss-3]|uniref:Glycoside hydrolase family 16 protein n=1 Tax=Sistotremastrum suecicum HHB10207 ss-3 TaxID=1314776 RepID=A0A165Z5I6_9AGAM|nr:glycoside hydrolase family 16 protein [Sistotremastrum suecicum HHB10207 ss-3]